MPENKTKPTNASVAHYIASRANAQQQADIRELMALFNKITRKTPRMWGPSMVGYGTFHYTYEAAAPAKCRWQPSPSAAATWWFT